MVLPKAEAQAGGTKADAAATENTGRLLVPTRRFKEEGEHECHDMKLHGAPFILLVDAGSAKRQHEHLSMKMAVATTTHHTYNTNGVTEEIVGHGHIDADEGYLPERNIVTRGPVDAHATPGTHRGLFASEKTFTLPQNIYA